MADAAFASTKKALLIELMKKLSIINSDFTGKVTMNFNQGGLTAIEKTEKIG